jgi:prepilin-type N-terminal cleavage/methylation domain-containing protein
MKKINFKNKNGFTLIEVIIVMILIGIVSIGLSGIIIFAINDYIFGRDAGQLSQRAQLALARIDKELIEATAITTASNNQITYTSSAGDTYILLRNGSNQITLNRNGAGEKILIDGLTANNGGNPFLTFSQTGGGAWAPPPANTFDQLARIQVWITLDILNATNHLDFLTSINPRSNGLLNAPRLTAQ